MTRHVPARFQLADHIERMAAQSPSDYRQFMDVLDYLHSVASHPQGHVPEGNVASVILRQREKHPAVYAALVGLKEVISTARDYPFDPKLSEAEWIQRLYGDPRTGQLVVDALDGLEVAGGLLNRPSLKPDYELPPKPPTLRDHISQAANEREPLARLEKEVDAYTANSAGGNLTLRETLETVGDETARQLGQDYTPASTEEAEPHSLRDQLNFAVETHDRQDWHGHEA